MSDAPGVFLHPRLSGFKFEGLWYIFRRIHPVMETHYSVEQLPVKIRDAASPAPFCAAEGADRRRRARCRLPAARAEGSWVLGVFGRTK